MASTFTPTLVSRSLLCFVAYEAMRVRIGTMMLPSTHHSTARHAACGLPLLPDGLHPVLGVPPTHGHAGLPADKATPCSSPHAPLAWQLVNFCSLVEPPSCVKHEDILDT